LRDRNVLESRLRFLIITVNSWGQPYGELTEMGTKNYLNNPRSFVDVSVHIFSKATYIRDLYSALLMAIINGSIR